MNLLSPGFGRDVSTAPVIFVADDHPGVGELISLTLTSAGFTVSLFDDPLALLKVLPDASPKPVLLVTDYQMPNMNGLELIQRCKAIIPDLKTLSVSGTPGIDPSGYAIQPDRFLAKPFRSKELVTIVRELLA